MGKRIREVFAAGFLVVGTCMGSGCGTTTTETGYEPTKLGLSEAQRKALYAPKYSTQQAQAQAEREQEMKSRRPGGSFY